MGRFVVLPFAPEHYVAAIEATGTALDPWRNIELEARNHAATGPAFTGFVDGELAGCAGVHCQIPQRGEAWAILTPVGFAHPAFVTRSCVRYLRAIIQKEGLLRVEADVVAAFTMGRYWVERMGFELEAVKRRYCAGIDFAGYVLFPGEDSDG
jgi:hypothetical protein